MAKGNVAKQLVVNRIQKAFGEDFIGEVDKKIYVWSEENGEKMQVALALTCPKVPVSAPTPAKSIITPVVTGGVFDVWDFEGMTGVITSTSTTASSSGPIVIEENERKNIEDLMKKLGL